MVSCQKMVNIRSFTWPGRVNQGKKPGFSLVYILYMYIYYICIYIIYVYIYIYMYIYIYTYTKTQQNIENTQLNQAIDMDL